MWLEEGREPPAVRLTRAGETFYVRDGRHRITAARVAGHVLIEAEVRDSWKTTAGAARPPLPHDDPRPGRMGPCRSSARAPRVGVVAPAWNAGTHRGCNSHRVHLVAGRSGPVIWRQGGSIPRPDRTNTTATSTNEAAGRSMPVIASHNATGAGSNPVPVREARVAQRLEQLPVCITTTAASPRNAQHTGLRAGVERLSGRAPGLGREARVRVPPS